MRGVQVGRIGGVPLEVPPLAVLWIAFMWWSLTFGYPRTHLGFPEQSYRYLALGATCLVLCAILIHEFVVLAAQRALGAPMPGRIVLGPWGSSWKAQADGATDPATIRGEILAGFLGPATYMAIAAGCIGVGLLLQPNVPNFLPTRAVTDTVAIAAATLAVLNLLPGAPLDAGRVLGAVVRRATGDPARAARTARFGGLIIGFWCCGLGIAGLSMMNSLWSFWGIIIGTALLEGAAEP